MSKSIKSTRLYCILARNAPFGVIFRRGPSKQVCLIKWNLKNDTFDIGQWFKGRIYERRCDLSPDGSKLVYFAAKFKKPLYSWTALSRPPFLTALSLWVKGDGWGGGGLFESEYTLLLNHRPDTAEMVLAEDFKTPKDFKVRPFGLRSGWGEDDPIYDERLKREGWILSQGKVAQEDFNAKTWIIYDPPIIYRKNIGKDVIYTLEMKITGFKEKDGPWYVLEYGVSNSKTNEYINLGRADWADWDKNNDLLYSVDGKLFRLKPDKKQKFQYNLEKSKEIADFSNLAFEEKITPDWAKKWK